LEALKELPDIGRLSVLMRLELSCSGLAQLPRSIRHLTGLQQLSIESCTFKDFPDIQVLTSLRTLELVMTKYAADCTVFRSLSRSLPCLRRLHKLSLRVDVVEAVGVVQTGMSDEDVLAIGRSLRAWPPPLLLDISDLFYAPGLRLHQQWQALGLPEPARDRDTARVSRARGQGYLWEDVEVPTSGGLAAGGCNGIALEFFRAQQEKMVTFASALHVRLGAASPALALNDSVLVLIADEILGGWRLVKEWQEDAQAEGGRQGGRRERREGQ
jgi:hypothetical protein